MKQLKIRFAKTEESAQIVNWINANPHNEFDSHILEYPTLQVICSYNDEPVAYLPMQRVLMLESTAVKPGLPEAESVQALRDLVKAAELVASSHGIRELYFLATDDGIEKVASSERAGFEVLPWKVLRLKLQ